MLVLAVLDCQRDPFGLKKAKAALVDEQHHESVCQDRTIGVQKALVLLIPVTRRLTVVITCQLILDSTFCMPLNHHINSTNYTIMQKIHQK